MVHQVFVAASFSLVYCDLKENSTQLNFAAWKILYGYVLI